MQFRCGSVTAGMSPRIMSIGPALATKKLCARLCQTPRDFDVLERNEAFASQGITVLRELGIAEDAKYVNPNGRAIALSHPQRLWNCCAAASARSPNVHRCRTGRRYLAGSCLSYPLNPA